MISIALYSSVKERLRRSGLYDAILQQAEAVEADVQQTDVVARDPVVLRSAQSATKALRGAPRLAVSEEQVEELFHFASGLSPEEVLALDVLLRRAVNPFEALATWPLEAFFSNDEIAGLGSARPAPRAGPFSFKWVPGEDADYSGYICLIVKFTRLCNLRCVYCRDWRVGPNQVMTFPVQRRLFQQLCEAPEHTALEVIWHGGEPTLLGKRGFLRVLALQRFFARPGQYVKNALQTNGTTLDQGWVEFLARFRFHVGVSLDGPAFVHDRTRPDVQGRPTFERVRRGLDLLHAAGMGSGAIVVVDREIFDLGAAKLVDFLRENRIRQVALLAARSDNGAACSGNHYLRTKEYIRFLLDVHGVLCARPDPPLVVRELRAAVKAISGEMAGYCELLGNCVGTFFSIDVDGVVSHCDKYVGDSDYVIGDIMRQSFEEIRNDPRTLRIAVENRAALEARKSCPFFRYCRGWCPYERYAASRLEPEFDPGCCGLSGLFEGLQGSEDSRRDESRHGTHECAPHAAGET
jgi:uncharacterized protein